MLGNAQDDAAPVSVPAAMGYAAQGNVEMNQARHEAEMESAVRTARERKALKEAMAGYARKPTDITTAEQFLSANRPPASPPREGDAETSPVKTSTYVPRFETTASGVNSSAASSAAGSGAGTPTAVAADLAEEKRGLFSFLRPKRNRSEETDSDPGSRPPPSDYPTPATAPVVGAATESGETEVGEAIATATVSDGSSDENPGFLRRLLGIGKKDTPPPVTVPAPLDPGAGQPSLEAAAPVPDTSSPGTPTEPTERLEIPSAPAFNGTSSAPPEASLSGADDEG
ncbi:MAG: hypothetical protein GXX91_08000 [Verrucomicrobiaceae bacterium]|nr:hypothetical protein [Verrucomicrobiaceae bacterium]